MQPVQHERGSAIATAAIRIAFVRSCFRPRWHVLDDHLASRTPDSTETKRGPRGPHKRTCRACSGTHRES